MGFHFLAGKEQPAGQHTWGGKLPSHLLLTAISQVLPTLKQNVASTSPHTSSGCPSTCRDSSVKLSGTWGPI